MQNICSETVVFYHCGGNVSIMRGLPAPVWLGCEQFKAGPATKILCHDFNSISIYGGNHLTPTFTPDILACFQCVLSKILPVTSLILSCSVTIMKKQKKEQLMMALEAK